MLLAELFVKVPHLKSKYFSRYKHQHLLHHDPRHALGAGLASAAVIQPVKASTA